MNNALFDFAIVVFCIILGAFNLAEAIKDFKKQRYFFFGLEVFGALLMVINILKVMFES